MKRTILLLLLLSFGLLFLTEEVQAQGGAIPGSGFSGPVNNFQTYTPTFNRLYSGQVSDFWPIINNLQSDQCEAANDFVIAIPPGGCTPSVVRSDLLEEQNVPVFCQLYSVQTNPLIKVSSIRSISFRGGYPEGVSSISYHPARAAARSFRTLTGDPVINNIGYVVIILSRNQIEENMEEWIAGNLTATIRYDAEEAFGVGQSEFYLPVVGDTQWNEEGEAARSSFWRGRGYLRAEQVEGSRAKIQILAAKNRPINTVDLREGETSQLLNLPGYYCRAGLRVRLNKVVALEDRALINIDGHELWVRKGSRILNGQCQVQNIAIQEDGSGDVRLSCAGAGNFDLRLRATNKTLTDATLSAAQEVYFKESLQATLELVETFGSVQRDANLGTYAEESLLQQISLARQVGKINTSVWLMQLYLEKYPDSAAADWVRTDLSNTGKYDYTDAQRSVHVTDSFHTIGITSFDRVDEKDKRVSFRIGTRQVSNVAEGHNESIWGGVLRVSRIMPGKVEFVFNPNVSTRGFERTTVEQGAFGSIGGGDVYVQRVDVTEAAYISLLPEVRSTTTEADFTFKVGIEKRAVQLSTERSKELLENVEESIDKWRDINDRLGELVKGWKGACFATSAFLMAKNVLTGFDGTSLARQKVMKRYKKICAEQHKEKTQTQCFNDLSAEIDSDVEAMREALRGVNEEMDATIENHKVSGGFLSDGVVVNQSAYVADLRDSKLSSSWKAEINGVNITRGDLQTSTQVRAVMLAERLKGTGGTAEEAARLEMEESLRGVASTVQRQREIKRATSSLSGRFTGGVNPTVVSIQKKNTRVFSWTGDTLGKLKPTGVTGDADTKIQTVTSGGKDYLFILGDSFGSSAGPRQIYVDDGRNWIPSNETFNVVFDTRVSRGECSYPWPTGTAEVRYHESGAIKGNPAIVPFDLENGFYAMVSDSNGNLFDDDPKAYTQAGVAKYFRICSIGPNKIMEYGSHDDMCQTFSDNTAASIDSLRFCPQKSSSEVQRIYQQAADAIRQAAAQYGDGRQISIFDRIIRVGEPMTDLGGIECQDFMSPEDCKLMFNVCDPVICPPSRCDMGGKNPVSDVIQTGIIGSIAQCLPNAQEGIYVPVCVSGIHAGLDAYVSILESERACLNRSIESGELVGICDEITSIYKCEFFWRQAAPLMNLIVPKLFTSFTGSSQGVHGGGEYLLAQHAWNNLDKSVGYFKDNYAQNAFRAFQLRNVEEAGGEFCRAFMGTSFPTSADAIDDLLEPESPPQFYAKFSEIAFSDVTVPATSQYKVYYHIYAGNDRGVQYRVYLKNPPASGYYAANPTVQVRTGYIPPGTSADEAIDFTAPEGYKELCVVIDAQEQCGFKQVTSDFGLDYLSSKFVEEQVENTDITTEKECISGSPSLLPLVQPNLQSGAEEALNPDISLRGIVRVCSHENPASSLNSSRWKPVGYCGEEGFTCWLDLDSVKKDLKKIAAIENKTIKDLEEETDLLKGTTRSHAAAVDLLVKARNQMKQFSLANLNPIISLLSGVTGNATSLPKGTNRDRAEAYSLKANAYDMALRILLKNSALPPRTGSRTTAGVGSTTPPTTTPPTTTPPVTPPTTALATLANGSTFNDRIRTYEVTRVFVGPSSVQVTGVETGAGRKQITLNGTLQDTIESVGYSPGPVKEVYLPSVKKGHSLYNDTVILDVRSVVSTATFVRITFENTSFVLEGTPADTVQGFGLARDTNTR